MPFSREIYVDTPIDINGEPSSVTTLTAGIDTDDTTLAFAAVGSLPAVGSDGALQSQLLLKSTAGVEEVTLKSVSGLGGVVVRGASPLSHASGAEVFIGPVNAASLNRLSRALTTFGDIEYLGATGALARLGAPANGDYLLRFTGSIPSYTAYAAPDLSAYALTAAVAAAYVSLTRTVNGHALSANVTVTASDLSLGNVENTALSTWAGSTSLTTLGTVATGTWGGTAIAAANGGTGQAGGYAVGDLLYASGATALSKLAAVAVGNALISGGVTTAPSWGKIGLTTHVSGILPVANGGTGIAYFTAAGPTTARTYTFPDANATILTSNAAVTVGQGGSGAATLTGALIGNGTSAFTAVSSSRGGLLYGNSSTVWATLAVGTVGKVLQSDGIDISWATPTGTGAPVLATSPTLVTPTLGAASATSVSLSSNGSTSNPALVFGANGTNYGLYAASTSQYAFVFSGTSVIRFSSDGTLNLAPATGTLIIGNQVAVATDAANVLAQRNSTAAQKWRVYNTFTTAETAGEWFDIDWISTGNVCILSTRKGSVSGVLRGMQVGASSSVPLGFYGATPITRAVLATGAGATADNIITALQNLGLVSQS